MKTFPLLLAVVGLCTGGGAYADQNAGPGKMSAAQMDAHHAEMMQEILNSPWRSQANKARDVYRHPAETLAFFGVTPHSKVIEIWPGGGWYSEILVPYASKHGSYTAAVNDPATIEKESSKAYYAKANKSLSDKFAANPEAFSKATMVLIDPAKPVLGKPGSADAVLTFRNVHNWRMAKQQDGMFAAFYEVLKKGGTLGVVEHRANQDVADDDDSGYVSEAQVITLATKAGFKLVAKSEINANAKDTKDYPDGVWTLPPTYALGEKDKIKYATIGESDRMTLKFVKP